MTPLGIYSKKWHLVAGWLALLIGSLLLPRNLLLGQQEPKIAVEVKVVSVLATVRDKHGQIVANLGKDNFVLEEDGRPQTINYFLRDTSLPQRPASSCGDS